MNQWIRWAMAGVLAVSVVGCGNDQKTFTPMPSVSAVSPAMVFLGRTVDVQVSGYATMWSDSTTIDFGPGVTVNKITAASATGAIANITVAGNAMTGTRDVTVTDGTNMEVFKGAFDVEPPVKVTIQGTLAQGSIALLHVLNQDADQPFDTTWTGGGLLGPPTYTNLAITGPAGATFLPTNASALAMDAIVIIDVDAQPTMGDLDIASGPMGSQVHLVSPASLPIVARTATPLMNGANAGMVTMPFDSSLYTFVPAAGPQIIDLAVSAGDPMATNFQYVVLPKSGHFADALQVGPTFVTNSADPYYIITTDLSGYSGYAFNIQYAATTPTLVTEAANNDKQAQAQAIATLPALVQNASISSATDEDWYSITVPAGKKVHVITMPGDAGTDTAVDVVDNGGTSLGGPSDNDIHEDFTSTAAPTAGTYYVHIYAGQGYDPSQTKYDAIIRLE